MLLKMSDALSFSVCKSTAWRCGLYAVSIDEVILICRSFIHYTMVRNSVSHILNNEAVRFFGMSSKIHHSRPLSKKCVAHLSKFVFFLFNFYFLYDEAVRPKLCIADDNLF